MNSKFYEIQRFIERPNKLSVSCFCLNDYYYYYCFYSSEFMCILYVYLWFKQNVSFLISSIGNQTDNSVILPYVYTNFKFHFVVDHLWCCWWEQKLFIFQYSVQCYISGFVFCFCTCVRTFIQWNHKSVWRLQNMNKKDKSKEKKEENKSATKIILPTIIYCTHLYTQYGNNNNFFLVFFLFFSRFWMISYSRKWRTDHFFN